VGALITPAVRRALVAVSFNGLATAAPSRLKRRTRTTTADANAFHFSRLIVVRHARSLFSTSVKALWQRTQWRTGGGVRSAKKATRALSVGSEVFGRWKSVYSYSVCAGTERISAGRSSGRSTGGPSTIPSIAIGVSETIIGEGSAAVIRSVFATDSGAGVGGASGAGVSPSTGVCTGDGAFFDENSPNIAQNMKSIYETDEIKRKGAYVAGHGRRAYALV
jgi:hypothetical protein